LLVTIINLKIFILRTRTIVLLIGFWLILTTCVYDSKVYKEVHADWKEIKKRGKLVAITNFNTIDYFIYNGQPMGFQFELLQRFAEYSGMQLEIIACNDMNEITSKLVGGSCDLIAVNMPVTTDNEKTFAFTEPLMQSKQVLVQRKPNNLLNLSDTSSNDHFIRNPLDLGEKTIIVQRNTAYAQRLRNISNEIGKPIEIIEVPEDEEQLIQFVAGGEIDYTVCDERVAQVNQNYYRQIDISTVLSFPQNLSWAVRKDSKVLQNELNIWMRQFKVSHQYAVLYSKYYQNQWSAQMVNSNYFVLNTGKISPYDDEIRRYSELLHWDWRLLASLIKQESNFNPGIKSWAGAYGLMQIMPATAQLFGVDSARSPQTNMAIGVKLLKWLDRRFYTVVPDPVERLKFVLASYNVGIGHVFDAQQLAKKYNKNPQKWDDVKVFLLNKSKPRYYKDPVVKFGYCNGQQPYNYVTEVLNRFEHYKNLTVLEQ
jgi:membrane-bound lytic murein transglycosylase F